MIAVDQTTLVCTKVDSGVVQIQDHAEGDVQALGVGVAAGSAVVVVIGQMHISGYEPRGNSAQAQRGYHQHCEVAPFGAKKGLSLAHRFHFVK